MENEVPTAEQLVSKEIDERKKSISNFFTSWVTTSYDKIFLVVLLIAFVIRLMVFMKTYDQAIWWDAADYLAAAKRWSGANPNMLDLWYYRRGFLWPLIEAFFFKIGLGEIAIRMLEVFMSTGIVLISYLLITEMFNKRLALLTSIALTLSWVFIFFTGRPLTNIPATFFLLLAVLFFWKGYVKNKGTKYFYLFGLFAAFAALVRMQYLMFSFPIFLFVLIREKHKIFLNKKLWLAVIAFCIILIPQYFLYSSHFGNPVTDILAYYFNIDSLAGVGNSGESTGNEISFARGIAYFLDFPYLLTNYLFILFIVGALFFFIDLVIGFDKILSNEELQKKFFIALWIIIPLVILGLITDYVEQRHTMPILPFLFLIAVYPLSYIDKFLKNYKKETTMIISLIIIILVLIPSMNFGFDLIEEKKFSYQELMQAGEWLKENTEPTDIIIGGGLPQLTYYSERIIYPFHLKYRRDLEEKGREDLDKFIKDNDPKYLVLDLYERERDWIYPYIDEKQKSGFFIPIEAYPNNGQPLVVIYKINYSN